MTNRQMTIVVLVMSGIACWGQSLGDVARASRDHAKQSTTKVVTNDDVKGSEQSTQATEQRVGGNLQDELDHIKQVFEQVCADPKTDHGRTLSDANRHDLVEAAKPLRARMGSFEQIGLGYKAELDDLNKQVQTDLKNADAQRAKAIKQEYESRRLSLLERAKGTMRDYEALQKQLQAVGDACPDASASMRN